MTWETPRLNTILNRKGKLADGLYLAASHRSWKAYQVCILSCTDVAGEAVTLPPKINNADETRPPRFDEGKVRALTMTTKNHKVYHPLVIPREVCI